MPTYKHKGKVYNIPDELASDFETSHPAATIAYENEGKRFNIPISMRDSFLSDNPNATLFGAPKEEKEKEPKVETHTPDFSRSARERTMAFNNRALARDIDRMKEHPELQQPYFEEMEKSREQAKSLRAAYKQRMAQQRAEEEAAAAAAEQQAQAQESVQEPAEDGDQDLMFYDEPDLRPLKKKRRQEIEDYLENGDQEDKQGALARYWEKLKQNGKRMFGDILYGFGETATATAKRNFGPAATDRDLATEALALLDQRIANGEDPYSVDIKTNKELNSMSKEDRAKYDHDYAVQTYLAYRGGMIGMKKGGPDDVREYLRGEIEVGTPAEAITKKGAKIQDENTPTQEELQNRTFGEKVVDKAADLTGMIGAGLASVGLAYAGQPELAVAVGKGTFAGFAASSAGESMRQAKEAGATDDQALASGLASGAIMYLIGRLPFSRFTKGVTDATKLAANEEIAKALASDASKEEVQKEVASLVGKMFGRKAAAREIVGHALSSGATFGAMGALEATVPLIYQNPDEYPVLSNIVNNAAQSALDGLIMGTIVGSISTGAEFSRRNKAWQKQGFVAWAETKIDASNPNVMVWDSKTNQWRSETLKDTSPKVVEIFGAEAADEMSVPGSVNTPVKEAGAGWSPDYIIVEMDGRLVKLTRDQINHDRKGIVPVNKVNPDEVRKQAARSRGEEATTPEDQDYIRQEKEYADQKAEQERQTTGIVSEETQIELDNANEAMEGRRSATLEEIQTRVGRPFWTSQEVLTPVAEGQEPAPNTTEDIVRVVTYADGSEAYIVGDDGQGNYAIVRSDGSNGFLKQSEIEAGQADGTIVDSKTISLNDYLDTKVTDQDDMAEQERMAGELASNLTALVESVQKTGQINIGTPESAEMAPILDLDPVPEGGVLVKTKDGEKLIGWQQVADSMNLPFLPKSTQEIVTDRLAQDNILHAPASEPIPEEAVAPVQTETAAPVEAAPAETATVPAAEAAPQTVTFDDEIANNLQIAPEFARVDGEGRTVVDTKRLWEKDPAKWAEYNDADPNQVMSSREFVESKVKTVDKDIKSKQNDIKKEMLGNMDQDKIDGLKKEIAGLQDRRNTLADVLTGIDQREKAMMDQIKPVAPVAPVEEVPAQPKNADNATYGPVIETQKRRDGSTIDILTKTQTVDGVRTTTAVGMRNGKEVDMITARFPMPEGLKVRDDHLESLGGSDGTNNFEILGVHELKEHPNGAISGTIIVRDESGIGKYEVQFEKADKEPALNNKPAPATLEDIPASPITPAQEVALDAIGTSPRQAILDLAQNSLDELQGRIDQANTVSETDALMVEKAGIITDMLGRLGVDNADVQTRDTILGQFKRDGASQDDLNALEFYLELTKKKNRRLRGFRGEGKVYLIADDITTSMDGLTAYVHENKHLKNLVSGAIEEGVATGVTLEELTTAMRKLTGTDQYDGDTLEALVDEVLANAEEIAEKYGVDAIPENLRDSGVKNENFINFVQNDIRDGREARSNARTASGNDALQHRDGQGNGGQNGRNPQQESRDVAQQGYGPDDGRRQGTGSGELQPADAVAPETKEEIIAREGVSSIGQAARVDDSGIQLSIRTEDDVERQIREFAKSKEGKLTGWTPEQIDSIIEETRALIQAIHSAVSGDKYYDEWAQRNPTVKVDWRDGVEKPTVTWSRQNVEYTHDMSADLLCINNEGTESVLASPTMVDLMMKMNTFTKEGFTSDDYLRLYRTLNDMGFVVMCKGCFDASMRIRMLPSVSRKFVDLVNRIIDERNQNPEVFDDNVRSMAGNTATIEGFPVAAGNKEMAVRIGVAGDKLTEHIKWPQLMSAEGQTKALSDWGGIFRAWQKTGAGRPKDKLLPEPWTGDIVNSKTTIIGKYGEKNPSYRDILVNQGTGLRRNSHSEFRPILAIDEIQFMREAFIRNLMVFKYMKELDDVRLFGNLGVKFNMSFFPAFVEGAPAAGLDKNGDYIAAEESVGGREFEYIGEDGQTHYDGMKGWQEAQKYVNKDVSLSSVVFSVPHLIKALTDVPTPSDPTGMWGSLIPYHATGATRKSLIEQGLGNARALGMGHGFEEAFTDYDKGVTNFEAVQNDRFGEGWVVVEGAKAGTAVDPGHKLEFTNGTHYYNEGLGIHLFSSFYIYDNELKPEHFDANGKIVPSKAKKAGHSFVIDYNDKVREIGTDTAYKDASDFYIQKLGEIGLVPRFDFDVPEQIFLKMCSEVNVDPNHPKLGWRGPGNTWSPVESEAYYSLFCDYGMIDPETGKWAPHMPVGFVDENGNRSFKLPDNTIDIIKDGIRRYSERKSREDSRILDAIEEFAKRTVAEGKLSQEDADAIIANARAEAEAANQPTSGKKSDLRLSVSAKIAEKYPNWMDDQTSTEVEGSKRGQNTQVAGTIGTYRKVGAWIDKNIGKDVKVLDASSGLGLGTLDLREKGFDIEDIEPYPGKGRAEQPTYGGVDAYQKAMDDGKEYDYIISNAVLNVIPDDWRNAVLHDMAQLLKPGGKMFINTRKAGEERTIKNKIELDSPQEILVGTPDKINSYQRFFKPAELQEYVQNELGDGYSVEIANKANSGTSGLAAVVVTKKSDQQKVVDYLFGEGAYDKGKADLRFSVTNQTQNGFISNAEVALDDIKMEKATPEQWLKMLEKGGGLKAGEDKWIGLSDWIKSQERKSLTKQDIADYIAEHRIQIEETKYFEEGDQQGMEELHPGFSYAFMLEVDSIGRPYIDGISNLKEAVEMYNREVPGDHIDYNEGDVSDDDYEKLEKFGEKILNDLHAIDGPRLSYTTEGLDNKREIALTVPTIEPWNQNDMIHFGDAGGGRAVSWIRFGDARIEDVPQAEKEKARAELARLQAETHDLWEKFLNTGKQEEYHAYEKKRDERDAFREGFSEMSQEPHKVLFIDEIQSKRHQEGRERGYKDDSAAEIKQLRKKQDALREENSRIVKDILHRQGFKHYDEEGPEVEGLRFDADVFEKASTGKIGSVEEMERIKEINKTLHDIGEQIRDIRNTAVPSAPFEKNWHELSMKRMLRYAAENGYDYVAWTTGEQQAERYNLSDKVDEIKVADGYDNNFTVIGIKDGGILVQKDVKGEQGIAELIGKDLARKAYSNLKEGRTEYLNEDGAASFSGDNLKIGGQGMSGFYDDILPRFMNKYGKKWGVSVKDDLVSLSDGAYLEAHMVPVTDEMKTSVLKGQTMFSVRGKEEEPSRFAPKVRQEMDEIRKAAEKDGTYMKAPNGQDTKLSKENWALVRTNNFKNWFGDWVNDPDNASKVVDENGEPRVVYHGTKWNPMAEKPGKAVFDTDRVGENFDFVDIDWNFFFTASEASAKGYGRAVPVFLNLRNPEIHTIKERVSYEMDEETGHDIVVTAHDAGSEYDEVTKVDKPDGVIYTIRAVDTTEAERKFGEAIKSWEGEHKEEIEQEYNTLNEQRDDIVKQLEDERRALWDQMKFSDVFTGMSYDDLKAQTGFVLDQMIDEAAKMRKINTDKVQDLERQFNEVDQKMFRIFRRVGIEGRPEYEQYQGDEVEYDYKQTDMFALDDPNQIKSAIGNNGGFDPDNGDIRFSIAGREVSYPSSVTKEQKEVVERNLTDFSNEENLKKAAEIRDEIDRKLTEQHEAGKAETLRELESIEARKKELNAMKKEYRDKNRGKDLPAEIRSEIDDLNSRAKDLRSSLHAFNPLSFDAKKQKDQAILESGIYDNEVWREVGIVPTFDKAIADELKRMGWNGESDMMYATEYGFMSHWGVHHPDMTASEITADMLQNIYAPSVVGFAKGHDEGLLFIRKGGANWYVTAVGVNRVKGDGSLMFLTSYKGKDPSKKLARTLEVGYLNGAAASNQIPLGFGNHDANVGKNSESANISAENPQLLQENAPIVSEKENNDIRFSVKDEDNKKYMQAVESGDMSEAQDLVDKVAEEAGYKIRGYHGTTHNFTIFDRSKGNAEGNWGKGFYFTTSKDDADVNYANEDGPDLTNRIEMLAENMEWMDGYEDLDYDQRLEKAREMLAGDNPHVISAAIRMENPLVIDSRGGMKETYFDYNSGYNFETDEYEGEESGLLVDFVNAWNDVLGDWEWEGNNIPVDGILEYADYDGLTASQLESKAREILDNSNIMNTDGEIASGEFLRQVFERMGFDGIVDNNVNAKFGTQRKYGRAMDGMGYGTAHIIAFTPDQIKQTDPVTRDDAGNIIPLAERFNPDKKDIRFSIRGIIGAQNDEVAMQNLEVAKQMEEDGKDEMTIWAATGWEKGVDGKWRNEIKDATPKKIENGRRVYYLDELIDAPELFKAYPDIADYKVTFKKMDSAGEFDRDKKQINLDSNYNLYYEISKEQRNEIDKSLMDEIHAGKILSEAAARNYIRSQQKKIGDCRLDKEGLDTIMHEIQHAIQEIEGFAKGGTTSGERAHAIRDMLDKDQNLGVFAHFFSRKNSASKLLTLGKEKCISAINSILPKFKGKDEEYLKDLSAYLSSCSAQDYISLVRSAARLASNMAAKTNYNNLAGEVEARNVEKRRHMSEEVRRKTPPSLTEDVPRSQQGIRFSVANQSQNGFISNAEAALDDIRMEKATPEQWIKMLEKGGGLKAGEDKWIGLSDWLKSQNKKSLTKQEIADYIAQNRIQIEEVHYSENGQMTDEELDEIYNEGLPPALDDFHTKLQEEFDDLMENMSAEEAYETMAEKYGGLFRDAYDKDDVVSEESLQWTYVGSLMELAGFANGGEANNDRAINATRLTYTSGGLKNKREIALTVPTIDSWKEYDDVHFGDAGNGRAISWIRFGDTFVDEEVAVKPEDREELERLSEKVREAFYKAGQEPSEENTQAFLAARDERDAFAGKTNARGGSRRRRVLVIDEIQSKRHQEGREKGYTDVNMEKNAREEYERIQEKIDALFDELNNSSGLENTLELSTQIDQLIEQRRATYDKIAEARKKGVPAAPFEKNWHELSMKRMLRLAAEEGYDYIAWTTGDQQAERYDLGEVVKSISGGIDLNGNRYTIVRMREGGDTTIFHDEEGGIQGVRGANAEVFVGAKNLSEIIGKDKAKDILSVTEAGERKKYSGENLRIGGEGMRGFYDDILPRFMNKYGKRWGVKVEDLELPNIYDEIGHPTKMHAVPVTEDMKKSVMKGQLMFSVKDKETPGQKAVRMVDEFGLPGVIGEEATKRIYWDSIRMLPDEIRGEIMDGGLENGLDFEKSANQYLGKLALGGTENDETGLLRVLYDKIRTESGKPELTDGDIRYMIWRNAQERSGQDDLLSLAAETAMKRRFGVGEPAPRYSITTDFGEKVDNSRERLDNTVEAASDKLKEVRKEEKAAAAAGELDAIVKSMKGQREYDRSTVSSIVKYAKDILKGGEVDSMTRTELTKLLTLVGKATGKAPVYVDKYADEMVDVLLDNIVKKEKASLDKLIKVKDKKLDKNGVEVMGKLDKLGQITVAALRGYKDSDPERIQERLAEVSDMLSSPDDAVRENAWAEHLGLELAERYHNDVKMSEEEADDLKREIKDAKDIPMSREAYREFVKETTNALRENKIQRVESMQAIAAALGEGMSRSIEKAREFRKAKEQRVEEIHHDANRDLLGTETREHRVDSKVDNIINNSFVRMMLSPLATFDQMLRQFGRHSMKGEGYLWNRYMRGWVDSTEKAFVGFEEQTKILDDKVSEMFGKDMIWSDLYDVERKIDKEHERETGRPHIARFMDGGEMRDHELTSGNLLYIYMVNKMTDGRMKLRKMGITQEDVDAIKKELDPRFIQLADWLQDEYLVSTRNKYNAVHEALFGAPMAAIENYFPLKINKMARVETVEPGGANFGDNALPSTTTGAIVKRRTNSLALDIMNADAFSVVIEHLQQMEDWAAFAPLREDLKTLLSYKTFRNKVMNMKTVYGSGEALWNNFRNAVDLASGVYKPKIDKNSIDKIALNVAKGVTGAKIAFRVQTALKQMLSAPAFLSDASLGELINSVSHPARSWNWCWDNLPVFRKRWKSRIAGDTRLEKTDSDWDTWNNIIVENVGRWGMTPNAFVDALTVSVGAKAMYETRLKKYKELGLPDDKAEKKAKQDATILYNQTQQSSEGAFISAMQKDRTFLAATLSTYRNSSMGYTRQTIDAIRNFARMNQKGRTDLVEFAKRQRMNEGADEDTAGRFSEKEYSKEKTRNAVRIAVFGFLLPFLWNMGVGPLMYTIFGKNKKRKEKILHDAALHTLAGPIEGLAGGNIISEAWNLKASGGSFRNFSLGALPAISDTKTVLQTSDSDPVKGMNQVIDLVVQSKFGVNPQTVTDVVVAIMDACNGDLGLAKEMALLLMRVTQFPQSAIEDFYFDEIDMSGKDASRASAQELIDRYAKYKVNRTVPLTGWRYTDAEREKKEKNQKTQIKKKLKERKETK